MVACHSDLVVFVHRNDEDLSSAQQNEVLFTPDRVQKVDLVFGANELSWAAPADREAPSHQDREVFYFDEGGRSISRLEYDAEELRRSGSSEFLDSYPDAWVRDGMLAVVDEAGHLSYYRESDELYSLSEASDRVS
jgi:hypothetical protein